MSAEQFPCSFCNTAYTQDQVIEAPDHAGCFICERCAETCLSVLKTLGKTNAPKAPSPEPAPPSSAAVHLSGAPNTTLPADAPADPTHPLDSVARELVREVRDRSLRSWRGWLRKQNEMGADIPSLRRQFDACHFDDRQVECVWRMLFECSDYLMSILLDYLEYSLDMGRFHVDVFAAANPGEEDVPDERPLEYQLHCGGEMLPGWYCGVWEPRYGQISPDWRVEKMREPEVLR